MSCYLKAFDVFIRLEDAHPLFGRTGPLEPLCLGVGDAQKGQEGPARLGSEVREAILILPTVVLKHCVG